MLEPRGPEAQRSRQRAHETQRRRTSSGEPIGMDRSGTYSSRPWLLAQRRTAFQLLRSRFSLRKEVIQPQVLLRLPCYDFTPIMSHTLGRCLPFGVGPRTSSTTHFRDVTGGVYKARERIHGIVLICHY